MKHGNKTPQKKIDQAKAWYRNNKETVRGAKRRRMSTLEGHVTVQITSARTRAGLKNIEFSLTYEWLLELVLENQCRCEQTGLPFVFTPEPRNPWQLSLDRIDSGFGYVPDNVQAVCLMYNMAKNSSSDADLRIFASALLENNK